MQIMPRIPEPLVSDLPADEELRRRVIIHLANCRPELRELIVEVRDTTVTLSGELPTFFLRQLAIERTRRVTGVRLLVDHIDVPALLNGFRSRPK